MGNTEFQKQVVFVTGAASGIGEAQAKACVAAGAKVFGVDLSEKFSKDLLESASFKSFVADLSKEAECLAAITTCHETFGKVNILLNTAGCLDEYRPLLETSNQLWQKILGSNLDSMFYLTKALLPEMLAADGGTIINMCSVASFVGGGGGIAYTTSKHAIAGFTKQLALDYADKGIHVTGIAPGAIRTPMNAADFAGDGKMAAWVAEETPLKRWAEAEEVAELTLFLASSKSQYLQGNIIPIDGGWLLK